MQEPELDLSGLDEVLAQWKKDREEDREELEKSRDDCERATFYVLCNLNKNREN